MPPGFSPGSHYISELQAQVQTLIKERELFKLEASQEKSKNSELEKEFVVLRGLIVQQSPGTVNHQYLHLKSKYEEERSLKISAEADIGRLNQ